MNWTISMISLILVTQRSSWRFSRNLRRNVSALLSDLYVVLTQTPRVGWWTGLLSANRIELSYTTRLVRHIVRLSVWQVQHQELTGEWTVQRSLPFAISCVHPDRSHASFRSWQCAPADSQDLGDHWEICCGVKESHLSSLGRIQVLLATWQFPGGCSNKLGLWP